MKRFFIPLLVLFMLSFGGPFAHADTPYINNLHAALSPLPPPYSSSNSLLGAPTPIQIFPSASSPANNTAPADAFGAAPQVNAQQLLQQSPAPTDASFQYQPIVPLPIPGQGGGQNGSTPLSCYINAVFEIAITIAVVLAVIMIVIDGFKYMVSTAVGEKKDALGGIRSALFGLGILLAAVLVLNIINPNITNFTDLQNNGFLSIGGGGCFVTPDASGSGGLNQSPSGSLPSYPGPSTTMPPPPAFNDLSGNAPPLATTLPGSGQMYGSGNYCFTTEGGGAECFSDAASCKSAQQYAPNKATSACIDNSQPLKTALPASGQMFGHGNYCFTTQGGGAECFTDAASCQSAQQYAPNKATSACIDTGSGSAGSDANGGQGSFGGYTDVYSDPSGYWYSNNPESLYYTGQGSADFAYFLLRALFEAGARLNAPIHVSRTVTKTAVGITPTMVKQAYGLPQSGGKGTIAIVDPYAAPDIESELAGFSSAFGLPSCTIANGCFAIHSFATTTATDTNGGWDSEIALDVEWAHAIAPTAKILLVSAQDASTGSLLKAVDYAANLPDVVAVSMSWGAGETAEELGFDSHFTSSHGVQFFAASGDFGHGVFYPAASPNVIAVGGTIMAFSTSGSLASETAWGYTDTNGKWLGSGGGVSAYEPEPAYQTRYGIPQAGGKRAVPDVAAGACGPEGPGRSGFATLIHGEWHKSCGTSAATPVWAAISALGSGVSHAQLYTDGASAQAASYFRDISSGQNGSCGYFCAARNGYDYVTGLGAPRTVNF